MAIKNKKIKIGVVGVEGRMGKSIALAILNSKGVELEAGIEHKKHKMIGKDIGVLNGKKELGVKVTDNIDEFFKNLDVVIEFGLEPATKEYLLHAKKYKKAFISGSTALTSKTILLMKKISKTIPVFWSPNMSVGANLIKLLSEKATANLGSDFDIDITDLHHKHKKDIPSGTALFIKDAIEKKIKEKKILKKKINIAAFRSGDSTGEHSVIFSGNGERIEIKHISSSRNIFSYGAVKVAKWIHKKKPGFYTMDNFLKI
jgi:4-hydroxy-tetrahydrodipicolinate reductase